MADALPHCKIHTSGPFTVFATREYYEQLTHDIMATKAGDRVALATMAFLPHSSIAKPLIEALAEAARRGVTTSLQVDSYIFMIGSQRIPGPLFWSATPLSTGRSMAPLFRKKWNVVQLLRDAGVTVTITNPPHQRYTSPFAGRSHIKYSVVNNTVYLGGCNIGQEHLDVMVRFESRQTADWIITLNNQRQIQPQTRQAWGDADFVRRVDHASSIIIDAGVKNQSAIYDEALAIIDRAKEWVVITCQYFPHSITGQHLKRAHERGVKIYPIFNHYSSHKVPHTLLQWSVTRRERQRLPTTFFDNELPPHSRYLHAKILATDQEVLVGSHNYVPAGVRFGTAEIALHTTNPHLSKACARLITEETALAAKSAFSFLAAENQ